MSTMGLVIIMQTTTHCGARSHRRLIIIRMKNAIVARIQHSMLFFIATVVQNVSICNLGNTSHSLQCTYLSGSDAIGCIYVLVSYVDGVRNITGYIDRSTSGIVTIDADLTPYSDVVAYALGLENIDAQLLFRANISAVKDTCSPVTTTSKKNSEAAQIMYS